MTSHLIADFELSQFQSRIIDMGLVNFVGLSTDLYLVAMNEVSLSKINATHIGGDWT